MSGAQTSSFPDQNILYNAASGATLLANQRNQLLNTQTQQAIGGDEIEMMARAAGTLMDPTQYPDTQSRAAAYPGLVAQLQSQGFAKNAPPVYPGDAQIAAVARLGTPSQTQAEWAANIAANRAYSSATGTGGQPPAQGGQPPATGGQPSVATAPSGSTIEPDALTRANAVRDGLIKRGIDPDTATGFAANALHESGANPNTGPGDAGASHGTFQWRDDRYDRFRSVMGTPLDGSTLDQQLDYVVHELNTTEGAARDRIAAAQGPAAKAAAISQYYLRPKDVVPEMQRRSATALQLAQQNAQPGQGTATAQAAPAGGPVVVGDSLASSGGLGGSGVVGANPGAVRAQIAQGVQNGAYTGKDVVLSSGASNAPGDMENVEAQLKLLRDAGSVKLLGVGPGIEAKNPGTNAALQKLAAQYGAQFVPLPADQMSPDGVHPNAAGYASLRTATAPRGPAPQDGRYQVASNTSVAPPGSTAPPGPPAAGVPAAPRNTLAPPPPTPSATTAAAPPPAPAPTQPPAGSPGPPQLQPLNARGLTAQQQAQLDAAASTGRLTLQDRIKQEQGLAQLNIGNQQKAFSDWIQTQQLATSQGQLSVSQANSALEYWKAAHPDAKVTMTGGEIITQDPRNGQEIAPRIQVTPNAAPRSVEGPGVWDGQKWVQPQPGQQGTPGRWTVGPGGGQFFPSQEAIVEEQKHDAARLADVRKETLAEAQGAAQTSTLIGNAEQAMTAAMNGKIPPGHFGPELLRITAAAKSLGIDLSPFGVDEKALAAGQVTREQLQQMNGAILRKMFPQRVTNVDLATTGAALPNYGLDPEALTANFRIYKAQADYDQAKAHDMLDYEAQHGGSLVGWERQWTQQHGFANGPLDNLFGDAQGGKLASGGTGGKIATPPAVGAVVKGHRFKGGDPSKQENWEPQ